MKAAVFDGKEVMIDNREIPHLKQSQVLIRVKAVGLCGTDLAIVEKVIETLAEKQRIKE